MKKLEEYVRCIPDFPEEGVMFRDVTSVLQDADGLHLAIDTMQELIDDLEFDVVVGPESRGFIFGTPIAYNNHKPFVLIRKKGKLPCETASMEYDLEYGTAVIEIHKDAIRPGQKILIVDDALFMRKSIRKILSEGGYTNVEEARDGEEAIALYGEYSPDLVLLDITMPGKSGLEVLEELLEQDEKASVVMCSAMGQESVIQKAVVMGARDFIVKPFRKDEFLRIVDSCFPIEE